MGCSRAGGLTRNRDFMKLFGLKSFFLVCAGEPKRGDTTNMTALTDQMDPGIVWHTDIVSIDTL